MENSELRKIALEKVLDNHPVASHRFYAENDWKLIFDDAELVYNFLKKYQEVLPKNPPNYYSAGCACAVGYCSCGKYSGENIR